MTANYPLGRLTKVIFVASLLLQLSVQPIVGNSDWMQSCSICHCHWNSGKKTADCKERQISTIPNDLSNELQVIDLSSNTIPELRREEFMEASLQNLHKIFLKNCTIQELNIDSLKGLAILIELDLSYNFIKELHVGTFNGLAKLRNLVMNNNQIEVLENYLFADLHFLSRVEFKNNKLKRINIHAFGQLPVLSAVYLESNNLTVLRRETFQRTTKLVHLSLSSNPWNCTCELKDFRDFAIAHRLYTPPTDCSEPKQLKGKLWNEVPSENFACMPRILGSLRSYVEPQSDNITLHCLIEGSPQPNVTWLYNKRPINPNDLRFRILNSVEQQRPERPYMLNYELHIFGVRTSDKGSYTCIADNRGGKAEAEFLLLINGDNYSALEGTGSSNTFGVIGATTSDRETNILLIICLIVTTLLLLLIVVVLVICWYCRRIKTYQKDSTILSENGLISLKLDKTHNGSMLESSVMEMQKSLLTDVNPVEKPPRRNELDSIDGVGSTADDGHEIKKTLLNETQFGNHRSREDETAVMSDTTTPCTRQIYIDDTYGTGLTPDLLAFPARLSPTSPSMQSSQSNIPDQVTYGIRSPPPTSSVYAHMTCHGICGPTTIAAATPNGFMTLQHPRSRNLALIAAENSRQHQSPFVPAPVAYSPATNASPIIKQGYMTIPRKPRVPSWAPSTSNTLSAQFSDLQSPISPNTSESGRTTTAELTVEPVYDNLGLRTTAGGSSTLNLNKSHLLESSVRYTMRDRPLPATPSLTSVSSFQPQQQQHHYQHHSLYQQTQPQPQQQHSANMSNNAYKIYEPLHKLANQLHQRTTSSDTELLYGTAHYPPGLSIATSNNNTFSNKKITNSTVNSSNSSTESKLTKIPPRPPPKPKKKMSITTKRSGHGSTSQLFDDEGEDGTEV